MKIVLAGGSGQVGGVLARAFHAQGDEVIVLGRRMPSLSLPWRFVKWDGRGVGAWADELEGSDAVFGLAGRSVNCRYTPDNRKLIKDSRVDSVRALGAAMASLAHPPRVWLQASTATIYQHTFGAPNDEANGIIGGDESDAPNTWKFSIDAARSWESAVTAVGPLPKTRVVLLRSAMTMSPDRGGVFDAFLRLVRFGLGGHQGDGRQFVSWIHDTDFVRAVRWILENEGVQGPINLASPHPLPNTEFMRALRVAWGTPLGLPAPGFLLEAGARLLRTETELILKSRRVVPGVLSKGGFDFLYPSWPAAAVDLCSRWRAAKP